MTKFWADLNAGFADWMPQLLWACLQTLQLTALTFLVAVPLGLIIVGMRLSSRKPLKWFAVGLIEVARGTPALVILFVVYFGLPSAFLGLSLN